MPAYGGFENPRGGGALRQLLMRRRRGQSMTALDTPRRPLYDFNDPLAAFEKQFGPRGGVSDLYDPSGRAYSDPTGQLLRMEGAGRARGAALRAKRGAAPGMAQFAALSSDLSSASDTARGLGEARRQGVAASQRFRGDQLGRLMEYGYGAERGERGFEEQRAESERQRAHEMVMFKKANKKKGGLGGALGGLAGAFLGPLAAAGGTALGAKMFEHGGLVDEPTFALIGEGDEDEAVVPESHPGFALMEAMGLLPGQEAEALEEALGRRPRRSSMEARYGEDVGMPFRQSPRIRTGRGLIRDRMRRAVGGRGGGFGGGGTDMLEQDGEGVYGRSPAPPEPFQEPAAVEAEGYGERLGMGLGDMAPPGEDADFWESMVRSGARSAGHHLTRGLRDREATRTRTQGNVDALNALKKLQYGAELAAWRGRQQPVAGDAAQRRWDATHEFDPKTGKAYPVESPAQAQRAARSEASMGRQEAAANRAANMASLNAYDKLQSNRANEPAIKAYEGVRSNLMTAEAAAKEKSGPGDIALIYSWHRALEPDRPNVVREGDVALTRSAISALQKAYAVPGRFFRGEQLTDEGRAFFLNQMRNALKAREADYQATNEQYRGTAKAFGQDPSRFIRDVSPGADTRGGGGRQKWGRDPKTGKPVRTP